MSSTPVDTKVKTLLTEQTENLFEKAREAGSADTLGELLEFYRPLLHKLCQRRMSRTLAGKISASEITQIAVINASDQFSEFRGHTPEQFHKWLCTILENVITDQVRHFLLAQRRQASRETSLPRDIQQATQERPSQICSAKEQIHQVLRLVDSLPDELRTVVRLRYQQDLTFNEIGEYLGLPTATARRRWLSAIEHIERALR